MTKKARKRENQKGIKIEKANNDFRRAIYTALIVVLIFLGMPQLIDPPSAGLDPSWTLSLGLALANHLRWGVQYLWTYGPLGFLVTPLFYPAHYLWTISSIFALLAYILLIYTYIAVCVRIIKPSTCNGEFRALLMIVSAIILLVTIKTSSIDYELLLSAIMAEILVFVDYRSDLHDVIFVVVGILLSLASLIKASALIVALPEIIIFMLVLYILKRERLVKIFIPVESFGVSYLLFWILAGQRFYDLPSYFRGIAELIMGYSSAMATDGAVIQTVFALLLIIGLVATVIYNKLYSKGRTLQWGIALMMLPIIFMVWKEGFVRHDPGLGGGHAQAFFSVMAVIGWLILISGQELQKKITLLPLFSVVVALYFLLLANSVAFTPLQNIGQAIALLTSKTDRAILQRNVDDDLRSSYSIPSTILERIQNTTLDIVPWDISVVEGYALHWDPSPVPQAYSVYTPYLDRLNAIQIASPEAAKMILFTFGTIDGRYPLFDQPAVFEQILSRYHFDLSSGGYTVLSRNAQKFSGHPAATTEKYRMGQWIKVPSKPGDGVFADVNVAPSLYGRIIAIVYKPAPLYVSFRLDDNAVVGPFRFISATGDDGLFVSEYVSGLKSFNRLVQGKYTSSMRVESIRFNTSNASQYDSSIAVGFSEVDNLFAINR